VKVQITARHDRKISDDTRNFIETEIEDLAKFYDKITSVQVVLDKQDYKNGSQDIVEILVSIDGSQVIGKSNEENLGKAFDDAKAKVVKQLKKQLEIKKSHFTKPLAEVVGNI
jgi:putative sigma-54 modulation protein